MEKLVLRAAIHETPAALRFGGDGAFVTFAIAESDVSKAVALIALKKTRLKLTVEVDNDGDTEKESRGGGTWPTVKA